MSGYSAGRNFHTHDRVLNSGHALNDDVRLIEATLSGRSAAFGQLVLKHQDRLFNTLVHLTGNREDARDLTQDAFVQAFLKLDTFKQSCAFYTWLYRIAFNLAATHHRRQKPAASVEQIRESSGREPTAPGDGPTERIEQEERNQQVREALARLGDEFREVVVLREIDGRDYETIAEILDLPVGTVRSRLHRARVQLRDHLGEMLTVEE
jgi:RNA polymerase sigma-70 factor, ECF subfamily